MKSESKYINQLEDNLKLSENYLEKQNKYIVLLKKSLKNQYAISMGLCMVVVALVSAVLILGAMI